MKPLKGARRVRAIALIVCSLFAPTCGSRSEPVVQSTTLSGPLEAFSAKGDDFVYYLRPTLTAGGVGATITSMDATIVAQPASFTVGLGLPLQPRVGAGATVVQASDLVATNQTGRAYATAVSIAVNYIDDAGRTGTLHLDAAIPSCLAFTFGAVCAKTKLAVGESSSCSGGIEFGCQPNYLPLTADQIQWQSKAPEIATMSSALRLTGVSNGSTTLTGTYGHVSSSMPVCVGPQCSAEAVKRR